MWRACLVTLAVVAALVLGVAPVAGLLGSTAVVTVSVSAAILLVAYAGAVLPLQAHFVLGRRSAARWDAVSGRCRKRRPIVVGVGA